MLSSAAARSRTMVADGMLSSMKSLAEYPAALAKLSMLRSEIEWLSFLGTFRPGFSSDWLIEPAANPEARAPAELEAKNRKVRHHVNYFHRNKNQTLL